ncbi:putative ABC transporter, ATP-binding/permease protein [Halobacteriovorax marinus SJ]|uniref:ABC transporter, ATP-binding/permease protein n=1 Tax=Halobacteriovorax marinus (strain ATCC BAA-682 / DSM 15412 / SJ) TaxID=862908 RepID=E1X2H2_HALMS|nr:ABC transporter ATP-binding protein [Halobacteriovorax marinus]CBW26739.1 putative ABC transporter, ATP-binding/permease protein [Halobacteriovorax marinus SJ]
MNNSQSSSLNIWKSYLLNNKSVYFVGTLMVLLTNICQVLTTRIIGWIIDFFSGVSYPHFFSKASKIETFYFFFICMFACRVLITLGRMGWRVTLARQTHMASAMLRKRIWENARFFNKKDLVTDFSKGNLMNASNSDVNSSRFIFGFTLVGLVDVIFLGILTLVTMGMINLKMTLISVLSLSILPYFVKKLSSKEVQRYKDSQKALGDFNDLSTQVISTIRLQRLTQTGNYWEGKLIESATKFKNSRLLALFTSLNYIPMMGGASIISYGVLFVVGVGLVIDQQMTIGDFVSMQGLIFLLQDPLMEMGFIISDWKRGTTSLDRLNKIYKNKKEEFLFKKGDRISDSQYVLSAKNLSFRYYDSDKKTPLIENFNLNLLPGERLGITGDIGTGKSTLLKILSGLERNYEGRLFFQGKDYNNYEHGQLREFMSFVQQKPFLFADTIKKNIEMDRELSDDDVWYYLELAGLDKDVLDFPDKLNTPLGEWGINLSGGQRQRLTLARALSRRPKLLFLDDCLSAVDTVTEDLILNNLDRELSDTTLIWVAHRSSTLKYCNKVLNLSDKAEVIHE